MVVLVSVQPVLDGQALMYCIDPQNAEDRASYEKTLYTDDQAVQEPCTARATTYTAFLISGMICKAVKDHVTRQKYVRVMHWDIKNNLQHCWGKEKV